ncbi:MAG: Gfo/Idh/MocA family oxidoreductase [Bacteroidales bacterium]|jgi:predicted dehydrogenase|nr:Gfo/Idh/MocA family oxidoreductase [Bacteroidales bacterium]
MFNVGIIGAGHIAEKAAKTLAAMDDMQCLAIGSRSLEKAQAFAAQFGVARAYGSYAELLADPDVQLVYIAIPHSHHFALAKDAVLAGKPCLIEKSFMLNAVEAATLLALAREKGVFVAEAIWPRYMPVRQMAREVLASGVIGKPVMVTASLAYDVSDKERVLKPELGGGALLDLGVYVLNFVRMYCDSPIARLNTTCIRSETGVDASEVVTMVLEDGTLATVQASAWSQGDNQGVIAGTTGYLVFDDLINPTCLRICRKRHIVEKEIPVPPQITGFEYQFRACKESIEAGLLEPPQMPHSEILFIMHLMDRLRAEWGLL